MNDDLGWCPVTTWWTSAWLSGRVPLDDVLGRVRLGLTELGELRRSGAGWVGLALPAEGDLAGLAGPPEFNEAAVESSVALVTDAGQGLVVDDEDQWRTYPCNPRPAPDLAEADRELRAAIMTSAERLADLDVARWRPEVADELLSLNRTREVEAPSGVPPRCVELSVRASRCLRIVNLARADDGAAVSASQMALRREALAPLDRGGRRALIAACSPDAWPAARTGDRNGVDTE